MNISICDRCGESLGDDDGIMREGVRHIQGFGPYWSFCPSCFADAEAIFWESIKKYLALSSDGRCRVCGVSITTFVAESNRGTIRLCDKPECMKTLRDAVVASMRPYLHAERSVSNLASVLLSDLNRKYSA
jgi:hypothetical protein